MFDKPRRDDTGPSQCLQCGSRLAAPLMFCPQCGANQLAASAIAGSAPDARRPGFASRLRAFATRLRPGRSARYGLPEDPAFDGEPVRRPSRWRRPLYLCGGLAVVAFAAYLVVPGDGPMRRAQTTEGAVSGAYRTPPQADAGDASTDAGTGLLPAQDIDIAGLNIPSVPGEPKADADLAGLDADAGSAAPGAASGPADNPSPAPRSRRGAGERTDVTRQLAMARADLGRNRLWPAHRAVEGVLAAQPGNKDALQLRAELASRERERDALIDHARECARTRQWACERQYAQRAANVDASSRDAKRLLARASGTSRETVVARRGNPDLLGRLHHWFRQSLAQADLRPASPLPPTWDRP